MKKQYEVLENALYFLEYDKSNTTLYFYFRTECLSEFNAINSENKMAILYRNKYFSPGVSYTQTIIKTHGVNDCGVIDGIFGNYTRIAFMIPVNKITSSGEDCFYCRGSGKHRNYNDMDCPSCKGLKKQTCTDKTALLAITETFSLLLFFMEVLFYEKEEELHDQLYMIRSIVGSGHWSHAIGGSMSKKFIDGINDMFHFHKERNETYKGMMGEAVNVNYALDAMASVWMKIKNESFMTPSNKHELMAWIRFSGEFSLRCEGENCCTISGSRRAGGNTFFIKEGQSIGCHNLDSAFQQIQLLVGLASLGEYVVCKKYETLPV